MKRRKCNVKKIDLCEEHSKISDEGSAGYKMKCEWIDDEGRWLNGGDGYFKDFFDYKKIPIENKKGSNKSGYVIISKLSERTIFFMEDHHRLKPISILEGYTREEALDYCIKLRDQKLEEIKKEYKIIIRKSL